MFAEVNKMERVSLHDQPGKEEIETESFQRPVSGLRKNIKKFKTNFYFRYDSPFDSISLKFDKNDREKTPYFYELHF